jgi:hypothetical protein
LFNNYQSANEHIFYNHIDKSYDVPIKETPNCDDLFVGYLKYVSDKTNKPYFEFIFKFVLLLREFYNRSKTNEFTYGNDFTQINNAEALPDFFNDFIVEYMEAKDYYGLDANELIELIQHLCFWLFSNKYTTSRLTLLG